MFELAQNAISSLTGDIPHAILCVRKLTKEDFNPSRPSQVVGEEKLMKDIQKVQKNLLKSTAGGAVNGLSASKQVSNMDSAVGALTDDDEDQLLRQSGEAAAGQYIQYVPVMVQYNPSSISFSGENGQQVSYSGEGLGDAGRTKTVNDMKAPVITMHFQLVFEEIVPADAFGLESLTLNAEVLAGLGMQTIGGLTEAFTGDNKTTRSIQVAMEGLVSLLQTRLTRHVIFFWGKMCFVGEVTRVSARYTMFNAKGAPIKGVVDMAIRQSSGGIDSYSDFYWANAYNEIFKEETKAKSNVDVWTNNSILNLNL